MYFQVKEYRDHDFGAVAETMINQGYTMTLFCNSDPSYIAFVEKENNNFLVSVYKLRDEDQSWNLINTTTVDDKKNIAFSFISMMRKDEVKFSDTTFPIEDFHIYFNFDEQDALDQIAEFI